MRKWRSARLGVWSVETCLAIVCSLVVDDLLEAAQKSCTVLYCLPDDDVGETLNPALL